MSKRIGEALVEKGMIDDEQLRSALRTQLMRGGHLGTSLVELGFVDPSEIGDILAEILDVEHANTARFSNIPQPVIDLIPRKVVQRHGTIPLKLEGRMLHVAMIQPRNLVAIDELMLATGLDIRPWVAAEVRIRDAMEAYYGIARRPRFVELSLKVRSRALAGPIAARPASPASAPVAATAGPVAPLQPVATPVIPIANEADLSLSGESGESSWEEILSQRSAGGGLLETALGSFASEKISRVLDMKQVSTKLCDAESIDRVVEIVVDSASQCLDRCVLFRVQHLTASIWEWRGIGLGSQTAMSVRLPLESDPLFGLLAGNDSYMGPSPAAGCTDLYDQLEIPTPTEVMMVPMYFEDQLLAILYGDGGERGKINAPLSGFVQLAKKAEIAFVLVSVKRSLCDA